MLGGLQLRFSSTLFRKCQTLFAEDCTLTFTSRILYAWENPSVPVDEVVNDVLRVFHHPALRHDSIEIQRDMFQTVKKWADEHPRRNMIDVALSSEAVRAGKNHVLSQAQHSGDTKSPSGACGHSHGAFDMLGEFGHGKVAGSLWNQVRTRDLDAMEGRDGDPSKSYMSNSPAPPGRRFEYGENPQYQQGGYKAAPPHPGPYSSGYGPSPSGPPSGYNHPAPQGYGAPPQPHYAPHGGPPPAWDQYPGQHHRY